MNDNALQKYFLEHPYVKKSWHHINAVRWSPTESYHHKRAKFEVANHIANHGGTFGTEYPFLRNHKKVAEADLIWFDENIILEFEASYTEKKAVQKRSLYPQELDIWVVDIGRWRNNFNMGLYGLLDKLGLLA